MQQIRKDLILQHKYPELNRKLPAIELGNFPTPIHRLQQLEIENLWIKRDDQSSSVYGGNKIRKLEFILAAARRKGARHLVSLGGIGTNHGLATAIFCDQLGIRCTLLLFHQPVTENVKVNLLLLGKYKAKLVYRKTLARTMVSYFLLYRFRYPASYFVYPGGSSTIGTIGYVNAAFELKEQIEQGIMPEPEVIFCPVGSGGSQAGLYLGLKLAGLKNPGGRRAGDVFSSGSLSGLHAEHGCQTDKAYLCIFKKKMPESAGYRHPGAYDRCGLCWKRLWGAHPGRKSGLSFDAHEGRHHAGSNIQHQDICRRAGLLPPSSGRSRPGFILEYLQFG